MIPFLSHELGSSGPRRAALALLTRLACVGLAAATSGCFDVSDGGSDPSPPSDAPAQESIDTDVTLKVTPGEGAGLWITYASGGGWDVFTSCDTNLTNRPCAFDIIISSDAALSLTSPPGHDLEPVDTITLEPDGTLHLQTGTAGSLDGVTFSTDPGAIIRIDMLLDGEAQPAYVNWSSGGVVQAGTTTNPVDFVPVDP